MRCDELGVSNWLRGDVRSKNAPPTMKVSRDMLLLYSFGKLSQRSGLNFLASSPAQPVSASVYVAEAEHIPQTSF